MRKATHYINTSADDCRITLTYTTVADLPTLREALAICQKSPTDNKTKIKHIMARIKKLER